MIAFELHPDAEEELYEAAAWYEDCVPGLGLDFLDEVDQAVVSVCEFPLACSLWPDIRPELSVRRKLLDRFPFGLPYLYKADAVVVLAVAHLSRRPGYWLHRTLGHP